MLKSLTIVIPAYNEERQLAACLDAIATQTVKPDEVIVVNNNSTDRTVEIAQNYSFVTLLHEKKQGFTPPRNKGFNAAKGDIIGLINGDAILEPDWVERVKADFAGDETLGALSGVSISEAIELLPFQTTFWSRIFFAMSDAFFRLPVLWGANMAIRRDVWLEVRDETCTDDELVHNDIDLSLVVASHGWRLKHDGKIRISLGALSYHAWPKFKSYMWRRWSTKRYHDVRGTLKGKKVWRLPLWYCVGAWLIAALPALAFILTSPIFSLLSKAKRVLHLSRNS